MKLRKSSISIASMAEDAARCHSAAVAEYQRNHSQSAIERRKLQEVRISLRDAKRELASTEDELKCLSNNNLCEIVAEVQTPFRDRYIVRERNQRYIVDCHSKVEKEKLIQGSRVCLNKDTLTIMRILPPLFDPLVYNMRHEDPGNVSYSALGGLSDQIRELRESIELPLKDPEIFVRVGIKPPKGVLLYGPPGTGKTLLARAIASNVDATFLKVASTAILDRYQGESPSIIREMFNYARDHQPCIIFMDEIDAFGGRRLSGGISTTLTELQNQLDGLDKLGKVKFIMATNRPDVLDPALLRPGRTDKKIEIPLPNEHSRMEILKIHAAGITKHGEIDYEALVKFSEGFNGADLRNVFTEAGMFALRAQRDYMIQEDFMKAVRKLKEAKKLESSAHY